MTNHIGALMSIGTTNARARARRALPSVIASPPKRPPVLTSHFRTGESQAFRFPL